MRVSVTDPIDRSWRRMVQMLFKPFAAGKWFAIGLAAFLASMGQGAGSNFNCQLPGNFKFPTGTPPPALPPVSTTPIPVPPMPGSAPTPGDLPTPSFPNPPVQTAEPSADLLREAFDLVSRDPLMTVLVVIAGLLVVVAIMVLFTWLQCRGRFMLIDAIATNRGEVVRPWGEMKQRANSLTRAKVLLFLITMGSLLGLAAISGLMAWSDLAERQLTAVGVSAIVVGGLGFLLVGLASALIAWGMDALLAPVMYATGLTVGAAWQHVRHEILGAHLPQVALFLLMTILLHIGAGFVTFLATCATCCLAALPYIGTVITLPIHVFLAGYSIFFVQQIHPAFTIVLPDHDEPKCPSCEYDLRGNPDATHCPECGAPLRQGNGQPNPPTANP